LVIVIVLMLAGGGGAAWYFMKDSGEEKATTAADKGKAKGKENAKGQKPPVFVNLEPFTVNLASEGSDRYLQTTIVMQMSDDKAAEAMKVYMPVIRNRVLMLLSSKRPSEIESVEGKQKLVTELVAAARETVPGSTPERGATGALFSSFVIQ
jgi:flagellar FliL protein